MSGQTVSHNKTIEELGGGGMGSCTRPGLERGVAVKLIKQTALDMPEAKACFHREARMSARLSYDPIAIFHRDRR